MSNDIKALFTCPICLDILNEPITTICGHNFCKLCICNSFTSITHCPCCRSEIGNIQNYEVNKQLKDIIDRITNRSNNVKEDPVEKRKLFYEKLTLLCSNSSFKSKKRSLNDIEITLNKVNDNKIPYNSKDQDLVNNKTVNDALGEFEAFLNSLK